MSERVCSSSTFTAIKFRKQYTHVMGSAISLNFEDALNGCRLGRDSRRHLASATLSASISLRSRLSPRRIFSTTLAGIGDSAGDKIMGEVLRPWGAANSMCCARSDAQSDGGITEVTDGDEGTAEGPGADAS